MRRKITRAEALTAYVLHLMMWDELSVTGRGIKSETDAIMHHHAKPCDFCDIAIKLIGESTWLCRCCPSKIKAGKHGSGTGGCLGGVFADWCGAKSPALAKKYAAMIRDIELADWFKELIK
jgi:hypothetical protein